MAELTYSRRTLFATGGGSGGDGSNLSIEKRTLIRTGGTIDPDTTITFNAPGPGWVVLGSTLTFSGSAGFTDTVQTFYNGQLLHPGVDASDDNDVYYVTNSSVAFEFPIVKNSVIQFWQFATTSG